MKNPKILDLANEVTINHMGTYDNSADGDIWMEYRNGVLAGMLEILSLSSPVLNMARKAGWTDIKAKEVVTEFEEAIGVTKTFKEKE